MIVDFPPDFTWPSAISPLAVAYVAGWAVGLGRCHVAKAEVMRDPDADGPVLAVVVDVLQPRERKAFQPFSVLVTPDEFELFSDAPTKGLRYVVGIELRELEERAARVEDLALGWAQP